MIHKVKLVNFQSHEETVIDLTDGVNVISGTSDTGKSGLYRGLYWCLSNELSGDFFIRHGETNVEVSVWVDDKREGKDQVTKITRYRSASKNEYRLEELDEPITGFRSDVPDIVEKVSGFKKAKFSDSLSYDLNFDSQHDDHFLLKETSGNITDVIGSATGVNIIDHAVKLVNNENREYEKERKQVKENINKKKEKINDLKYIDDYSDNIDSISNNLDSVEDRIKKLDKLKNKLNKIKSLKKSIKEIQEKVDVIEFSIDFDNLSKKFKKWKSLQNIYNDIKNIKGDKKEIENKLDSITDSLFNYNLYDLENNIDLYKNHKNKNQKINKLKNYIGSVNKKLENLSDIEININRNKIDRLTSLKSTKEKIVNIHKKVKKTKKKYKKVKKKFHKYDNELEELVDGKVCSMCNQPIKKEKLV